MGGGRGNGDNMDGVWIMGVVSIGAMGCHLGSKCYPLISSCNDHFCRWELQKWEGVGVMGTIWMECG